MTQVAKKILVTCALPYANGSIHLGHMLEHIQADVWVRYQRMRGHGQLHLRRRCPRYTDHAESSAAWYRPEQIIGEMSQEHQTDFAGLQHPAVTVSLNTAQRNQRCCRC